MLLLLLLLFVCVVLILIPQVFNSASGNNNLPVAIHSNREADYSINNLEIPLINIGIVSDNLRDLELPPGVYKERGYLNSGDPFGDSVLDRSQLRYPNTSTNGDRHPDSAA